MQRTTRQSMDCFASPFGLARNDITDKNIYMKPPPLGQILLKHNAIDAQQLAVALASKDRARLGDTLANNNIINPLQLGVALAEQAQLPFINLRDTPADAALLAQDDIAFYRDYQSIPWQREHNQLVIVCAQINAEIMNAWRAHTAEPLAFAIASPRDIHASINEILGQTIEQKTRRHLRDYYPQWSAYHTFARDQRFACLLLFATIAACTAWNPHATLIAIIAITAMFYSGTLGLKWMLYLFRARSDVTYDDVAGDALPIYTVLVPLYREQEGVARLLKSIAALDYPKHKLDVKLVTEADDAPTIAAIIAQRPPAYCEIIRVPPSQPRTKPKACNYAMAFARGDYVVIFDAEDQPEPMQLRKAVAAFAASPTDVVCLQARLNYYNAPENLLTKLFALEYACLFDFMLPGLQALGIPIPLGGTSNHIRTQTLREVGEWDPYNVTEDADLGMRLALHGYSTRVLDSITLEEAPLRLSAWHHQRARWIKGYMQTWLVYMRAPVHLYRTLGPIGFWGFQFFIGGPCLVFLLSPLLWGLCAVWALGLMPALHLPQALSHLCIALFVLGTVSHIWLAYRAARNWKWKGMTLAIITYPFYWFLHSIASFRALRQLITCPHHWDKTTHSVSRFSPITTDSVAITEEKTQRARGVEGK